MTRRFLRRRDRQPPEDSSQPGPLPSRGVHPPSSERSQSSGLGHRITGFIRNHAEKHLTHRLNQWFHRKTDHVIQHIGNLLSGSTHENVRHPSIVTADPSVYAHGPLDSSTISNATDFAYTMLRSHDTDQTAHSSEDSVDRNGAHQRRGAHPRRRRTSRTVPNYSFDHLPTYYGWSPYWQTPPLTPSSHSVLSRTNALLDDDHTNTVSADTVQVMTWPPATNRK